MNLEIKNCANKYSLDENTYRIVINLIETYLKKLEENLEEYSKNTDKFGVLLLIGEIYPLLSDREKWDEICYDMMVKIKSDISVMNINNLSICDGISNIAFAIRIVKENTGYFGKALNSLDNIILDGVDNLVDKYTKNIEELKVFHYDSIYGLSGIASYILLINNEESKRVLRKINNYLINLTEYYELDGVEVPGWYIKTNNQLTDDYIRDYPNGSINYSLSHGIAGCLAILSITYINGIEVPRQREAIETILEEYKKVEYFNEDNVAYWPGMVSLESYKNKDYYSINDRMSWCYGSIGILRSMYLASLALNNKILKINVENMINDIAKLDLQAYKIESPIICHGYAGASSILRVFYEDTNNDIIREKCIELIYKLKDAFSKEYKFCFKDVLYKAANDNWVRVEEDKNDFLNGSIGIVLELLAYIKDSTTFEKLLLIK